MKPTGVPDVDLGVNRVGVAVFVICVVIGGLTTALVHKPWPLIPGILIGAYFLYAIRIADQWEKVAVLRFGKYIGLRGPGLFIIIPIVDALRRFVDQRVRVANVSAESHLTRDTVPVNVAAI